MYLLRLTITYYFLNYVIEIMKNNNSNKLAKTGYIMVYADRRVISAESFYHPLRLVWHGQDGAETTVMRGEWTTSQRGEWRYQRRRQLVQIVR